MVLLRQAAPKCSEPVTACYKVVFFLKKKQEFNMSGEYSWCVGIVLHGFTSTVRGG